MKSYHRVIVLGKENCWDLCEDLFMLRMIDIPVSESVRNFWFAGEFFKRMAKFFPTSSCKFIWQNSLSCCLWYYFGKRSLSWTESWIQELLWIFYLGQHGLSVSGWEVNNTLRYTMWLLGLRGENMCEDILLPSERWQGTSELQKKEKALCIAHFVKGKLSRAIMAWKVAQGQNELKGTIRFVSLITHHLHQITSSTSVGRLPASIVKHLSLPAKST